MPEPLICPGGGMMAKERIDDGYYVACPDCDAILLPRVGGIVPAHRPITPRRWTMPSQKSLTAQVWDMIRLANIAGLYDAADWAIHTYHWPEGTPTFRPASPLPAEEADRG